MTSESLPPQSNSHDAQPANGGGQPSDGAQAPGAPSYPQASVNTGEYRRTAGLPAGSPPPEADAHAADTGPLHRASGEDADARPAVWQPRPSGALAAEAWSKPSSGAGYPTPGNSYAAGEPAPYGTGQYGTPGTGQFGGGQFGTGQSPADSYGAGYPTAYYGTPGGQQSGYGDYRQYPGGAAAPVAGAATATKPRTRHRLLIGATAAVLVLGGGFGAGYVGADTANNAVADSSLSQQSTAPVVADTQPVVAAASRPSPPSSCRRSSRSCRSPPRKRPRAPASSSPPTATS